MAHFFQYLNLSRDALDVFFVFYSSLFKYFYRNLKQSYRPVPTYMFVCQRVSCQFNFSESSLPQTLIKHI